ncbi:MAG: hypothetical protein ACHBN1_04895 [Heteroscytonema crispum UTEX LB 1556]
MGIGHCCASALRATATVGEAASLGHWASGIGHRALGKRINNPTGEPVAWVGKTPLAPLGETPRPQWLPSQAPQHPPTQRENQLPARVLPSRSTRFTSYLRECYPPAVRASPTNNYQQLTTNN